MYIVVYKFVCCTLSICFSQMEYSSEQRVNIWYNIKPIESSKQGTFGSKVSKNMRALLYS